MTNSSKQARVERKHMIWFLRGLMAAFMAGAYATLTLVQLTVAQHGLQGSVEPPPAEAHTGCMEKSRVAASERELNPKRRDNCLCSVSKSRGDCPKPSAS